MRLTRWEPFRDVDELFGGFTPFFGHGPLTRFIDREQEFIPLADVVEREKEYLIKLDLPEVRKEDVKILVDEGMLSIKGERKHEKEIKDEKVHRTERFVGTFERSFMLPENIDEKLIKAESKEGVLMIHLPKVEIAKTRPMAITIQ